MLRYWLLALAVTLLLTGCGDTPHRIRYPLDNVRPNEESPSLEVRLMISPLRDVRARVDGNQPLFRGSNETQIDGVTYCANAEEGYNFDSVGTQISEMLAEHLRKRHSFRAVSVGSRVPGAYYLSGTLRRYYAIQVSSTVSPTTALLFGLTGVVVEASLKPDWAPGLIAIEIVDLNLYDNDGHLVTKFPEIKHTVNKNFATDAYECGMVYDNVDTELHVVFNEFVLALENSLETAVRASRSTGARARR